MSTTKCTIQYEIAHAFKENRLLNGVTVQENEKSGELVVRLDDHDYHIEITGMTPNSFGGMSFGGAIACMKRGLKVARQGWNGKGMYLWLLPLATVKKEWVKDPKLAECFGDSDVLECLGSIRMFTADKKVLTGWLASQTDMLSEDWVVVE